MNGDTIEIVLNPAAHWSDGEPVTGSDVKYTFELGRTYKSLRVSPRWRYIHEIRLGDAPLTAGVSGAAGAPDAGSGRGSRRVVFVLDKEHRNPLAVLDALQETVILPRHIIEPLLAGAHGDLDEFTKLKFDQNPVGSGPYRLVSYSSEKIVMGRDDAYWGNDALHHGQKAAPKYIIDPIYKSNDNYSVALQQGRLDASICFVPRIRLKQERGVRAGVRHRALLRFRVDPDAHSKHGASPARRRCPPARDGVRGQLPRHSESRRLWIQRAAQTGPDSTVRA